jgi:hypothetical protein
VSLHASPAPIRLRALISGASVEVHGGSHRALELIEFHVVPRLGGLGPAFQSLFVQLFIIAEQALILTCQSMFERIPPGFRLPFGGLRTGGLERIGLVGHDLFLSCHNFNRPSYKSLRNRIQSFDTGA